MVQILDLLFLLLLIGTASAKFPEVRKGDSKTLAAIKEVHQTWDSKKDLVEDNGVWNFEDTNRNIRKKRSVSDNPFCDLPGYTGENCEFPICETINNEAFSHPTGGLFSEVEIDTANFDVCNFSMYTVMDSSLRDIVIKLDATPQAYPDLHLFDNAGNEVDPILHTANVWTYARPTPGLYRISVEAPSIACFLSVGASSSLVIDGGFVRYSETVASDRIDFPETDVYAMQPSTFIVHAYGLTRPGQIITVTMFQRFNHVARPQTLLKRYGCAYEYFVESFYCREKGFQYYYRIDGVDFSGNRFRRLKSFACMEPPPTKPVPTTPADPGPKQCKNGGVLMKNPDGTTFCYCRGYYTGRDCSLNLCLNGGSRLNYLKCRCPAGFTGNNCQDVVCIARADMSFQTNRPTVIFVIRAQLSMKGVIDQIAVQIRKIVKTLEFDPGYLQYFGLVLFNKNNLLPFSDIPYSTVDELIDALQTANLMTNNACEDIVLTAIAEAISVLSITNHSPVYVITDAVPNDEQKVETIFNYNTYRGSPIYVIYLEPPLESGCTMDVYHTGYQAMVDITQRTSGHVFVVPNTDTLKAGDLFFSHALHTIYRSSLLSSTDSQSCANRKGFFQPVRIDRSTKTIVVTSTGTNVYLELASPGTTIPPQSITNFTLGDTKFWWFENLELGTWKMNVFSNTQNSGPCSARIYSTRMSSQEKTEYDLFLGYSPNIILDSPRMQPVVSEYYSLVAHVNNYVVTDPSKVFAELIVSRELSNGRQERVFLSNGLWRDQCDYELYFQPMICHIPNEILYFSVYIRDELGFMFQRSGVGYCSESHPTIEPPSDCLHGGVQITLPNATVCFCTPDWTGNHCEVPVCHNGGTLNVGSASCDCTIGHLGQHCEFVHCIDEGPEEEFAPIFRDMAFVVELTQFSASAVKDLSEYISIIIRDMSLHHPNWIANYYLAAYNSTWSDIVAVFRGSEVDQFIQAVQNLYNPMVADRGCKVHVWEALEQVMDWVRPDAYVNLFHVSDQYVSSVPYFGVAKAVSTKRITLNSFYGFQSGSATPWFCNGTDAGYDKINVLCELNGGRAYPVHPSNFHEVYRLIPSYFQSALVYVRKFDDCSTAQQSVYFPIDSYTQSIQLNVRGYNNQITVSKPDGTQLQEQDYDNVYSDEKDSGWKIWEIRKPCDPDWAPMGTVPYCALVVEPTQILSWTEASTKCRSNGGFLIDIVGADTDDWIKALGGGDVNDMWIGLNNRQDLNAFTWDQGASADPIKLGSYANWDDGEPVLDQNKLCVLRKKGGKWATTNCNDQHAFICFKHKYATDFQPTTVDDDDLRNGKWWVTIKTEQQPVDYKWKYKGCMVEVHVQSDIQVFPYYALNEHSDVPVYDPTTGTDRNRFIANLYGGQAIATLNYANLYDFDTLEMFASTTYEKRAACTNYPWLSQTFSCSATNSRFSVIHIGEDQNGANFQRMSTGTCPPEITNCNHGWPIGGLCVCDDYWAGDRCDKPYCVNSGVYNAATNACDCPAGFSGTSCEMEICLPKVTHAFSTDDKTFGLVIELTIPNKPAVQKLVDNLQTLMESVNREHSAWFSYYVAKFITSTAGGETCHSQYLLNFVECLKRHLAQVKDAGTVCGAPLFGGLTNILSSPYVKPEGSIIFVLTRSTANDAAQNLDGFTTGLSVKKAQINYLIVDDTQTVCGKGAEDDAVKVLSRYALETGGNFFILPTYNYINFLTAYLPALHSTTLIITPTITDLTCENAQWFAQVDYKMDYIYLTAFAPPGTRSTISNPQGVTVTNIETLYSQDNTRLIRASTNSKPGIYTIKMDAPNPCSIQVRGDSPVAVYSSFTQPPQSDSGSHMDGATADPVKTVRNVVNLHLEGVNSTGRLTYTELLNPYDRSVTVLQLFKRNECSYEFYSSDFSCTDQDFLIMVNGIDDYGINFRREVAMAHCYNTTQPTF